MACPLYSPFLPPVMSAKKEKEEAADMDYEAKVARVCVIAKPLASEKLCKKVLKLVKAGERAWCRRGIHFGRLHAGGAAADGLRARLAPLTPPRPPSLLLMPQRQRPSRLSAA